MPSHAIDLDEAATRLDRAQVVETSLLPAPPAKVWDRIASMRGVNAELMPFVRMTYPPRWERLDREPAVPGHRLFRSILLVFGVLPIDVHAIALLKLDTGRGFLESSSSLLQRHWIHERTLQPESGGTRISDRVYIECRLPVLEIAVVPLVRTIFRRRHAHLRRSFADGHVDS